MKHYVGLKNLRGLPPFMDLAEHAFDKSIRKKDRLGFNYMYGTYRGHKKTLSFMFLQWPKWEDNPHCPEYARSTVVSIVFSPFHRIPHNKIIARKAKAEGFPFLAQILVGSPAGALKPTPALVDHRTFHRLVGYFASRTGGIIYEDDRSVPLTPSEYYKKHKKIIDHPFHLKLMERDIKRYPSNSF